MIASPSFLEAGGVAGIGLSSPNERDEPMTGFVLDVPSGVRLVRAYSPAGWRVETDAARATWSGGSLAPDAEETFHAELEGPPVPGPVVLETEQLYPGGEVVRWAVPLTVVPAAGDAPSENVGWALAVALVGLLVTVSVVALAWRRRTRSLQER